MNKWDTYCHLRANNPSKVGWALLVAALLVVLVLALHGAFLLVALQGGG